MLKILYLLSFYLAIGLSHKDDSFIRNLDFIEKIRDDYCADYCTDECSEGNDKTCSKIGNSVITDKYEIKLNAYQLTITWKTNLVSLALLKKLNASHNKLKAAQLTIRFNEVLTEEIPYRSTHYLKALDLYYVRLVYGSWNNFKYIHESEVYASGGPETVDFSLINGMQSDNFKVSSFFNTYFSETRSNLKDIYVVYHGTLFLRNDIFQNNTQLVKIGFSSATLRNMKSETFENLTNIKWLRLLFCRLDNYEFFRSKALQNSLETIYFFNHEKLDLKYFESYRKLQIFYTNIKDKSSYSQEIIKTNVTAFICYDSDPFCHLNMGINGKRCPSGCSCVLQHRPPIEFIVNCTRRGQSTIPELPIPIIGNNTSLDFEGNGLTQLPNTFAEGYNNLQVLHLANNNLTSIKINQLPKNLRLLDIRNNSIQSLEPNVAAFLMEKRDEISLWQSGIYWISNCKNKELLSYLDYLRLKLRTRWNSYPFREEEPVHFHHLRGLCPDDCTCCVHGPEETQFVINCTGEALQSFPIITNNNILGESSLLLDDNLIEALPTSSMRNSFLEEMHLKNNSFNRLEQVFIDSLIEALPTYSPRTLTLKELHLKNNSLNYLHLDQLPFNLSVLDIRQNNLTGLDDDVTEFIANLKDIRFSGNPWECSCKFSKFLAYLRRYYSLEYKAALRRCSGQEYCPDPCTCCKEDESRRFIVNCSSLGLREIPAKLPTTENATLLFEYNNLRSLNRSTRIEGFDQLKELHLRFNGITKIEVLPEEIEFLDIRNNSLSTLSENLREFLTLKSNTSSLTIFITGNPWICHCKELLFFRFTKSLAQNIKDLCKTECSDSRLFVMLEEKDLCPPKIPKNVIYLTSLIMLSCLLSFLQCFWKSIRMWLYEKRLFLRLTTRLEVGTDTKYDCFLAYCHKDSHMVKEYVERLEHGRNQLHLCFYERDWLAGEPIPDCICHSVENSRCTVIIMTRNFLKSVWGRLEFRLALHATSKDQHKRLIVIVYPDVENFDELDTELQSYMKLNTYLMRSDANFWNKLIYALPHKTPHRRDGSMEVIQIEPHNAENNPNP